MRYSLDLSRISLATYQALLSKQTLLPGRRILQNDLGRNFAALSARGIDSLAQLKQRLSTPQKQSALAAETGISEEYLVILKREIGSLEQKPIPLTAFPGLDPETVAALNREGFADSKDCIERGTAVSCEVFSLCDLARINGVGGAAAAAFYAAGYRSVSDVASANAADMLRRVGEANAEYGYYKAKLGEKDMQFCIDFARLLRQFD